MTRCYNSVTFEQTNFPHSSLSLHSCSVTTIISLNFFATNSCTYFPLRLPMLTPIQIHPFLSLTLPSLLQHHILFFLHPFQSKWKADGEKSSLPLGSTSVFKFLETLTTPLSPVSPPSPTAFSPHPNTAPPPPPPPRPVPASPDPNPPRLALPFNLFHLHRESSSLFFRPIF